MLIEPSDFKALPGRGVEAKVLEHQVFIGNMAWMHRSGVNLAAKAVQKADNLQQLGCEEFVAFSDVCFFVVFDMFYIFSRYN